MNGMNFSFTLPEDFILRLAETSIKLHVFDLLKFASCDLSEEEIVELTGLSIDEVAESLAAWEVFRNDVKKFFDQCILDILDDGNCCDWFVNESHDFMKHKEFKNFLSCVDMVKLIAQDVYDHAHLKNGDEEKIQNAIALLNKHDYTVTKRVHY